MPDFIATHRVTHEATMRALQAGIAKATALDVAVSIAVVDASGSTLSFVRMDGARLFSASATLKKAITSASHRLPTGSLSMAQDVEISAQIRFGGDFTTMPGGFPIEVQGQVVGGLGVGGATREQDVEIAQAALAALNTQLVQG